MALDTTHQSPRKFTRPSIENALAELEKGQQLAGHFPSKQALEQAQAVLEERLSADEAVAAVIARHTHAGD